MRRSGALGLGSAGVGCPVDQFWGTVCLSYLKLRISNTGTTRSCRLMLQLKKMPQKCSLLLICAIEIRHLRLVDPCLGRLATASPLEDASQKELDDLSVVLQLLGNTWAMFDPLKTSCLQHNAT